MREFRTLTEVKITNIDERLKRIEAMIDTLKATILGKIGSHIQNIQDIKTEMQSMQETFSKILNPLVDKSRNIEIRKPEKEEKIKK